MKQEITPWKTEQSELMSNKKVYTTLDYIEHFFILASEVTWCISISAFFSLHDSPIGVTSSALD